LAPDKPASTITARFDSFTRGRFAHPYEDRNITLREGARLQTFNDSYKFAGTQEEIAAMIGNAVPPRLAEIIGKAIFHHLEGWASGETGEISLPINHTLREVNKQLDLFKI
jgi:DNA (cytosine-5)-methyltransferase 1